ncbi:MAG: sulfotransferase [Phycisphaerales bacterium]
MPMLSMKDAYEQAKALFDKGSYRAAVRSAGVLYKQVPHHPPVVALYVGALLRFQQYDEGVRIARRSLRYVTHKGHRVAIITQLSEGLTQSGAMDEAIELVRKEIEKQPDHPALTGALTHMLVLSGRDQEAIEYIDALRARGIENLTIAAVFGRAVLRTDRRDEGIEWLNQLLEENDDAPDLQKHTAYNALGHLLDRAKRYDEAMDAFNKSNAQVDPGYDEQRYAVSLRAIRKTWTPERLAEALPRAPEPSGPRPVFIVGMPRSGTTLTEQIIDAHPKAHGAGELGFMDEIVRDLAGNADNQYATGPDEFDPGSLRDAAAFYRERIAELAGDESVEVVVDKAPLNFHHLGLITLLFPDARIIHCRRDPRDTCLSCYFQLLNAGHAYSFDLRNCGIYYRRYVGIMGHYRDLLIDERVNRPFFENVYEEMVTDQERRTREILDFIGLDFDPACLDFHSSGRVALTLSNDQVRQPMYKSSTKRFERYAEHLGPLIEGLGDVLNEPGPAGRAQDAARIE